MKKIVYIAHPIGGDNIEKNIESVWGIIKQLSLENEVIPFAPYLVALSVLDDANPEHRKIGFEQNKAFFERGIIDEVWMYGLSPGVLLECGWADYYGIKIISKI